MHNRTKIVATVGPSSESEKMLAKLIDAGVNVFRLNVKHNTQEWQARIIGRIRKVSAARKDHVGIMMDLQGPEVCIESFKDGSIDLKDGERVLITSKGTVGSKGKIILKNSKVLASLKPRARFFMDDGNLEFEAVSSGRNGVVARVVKGAVLYDRKSVNMPDVTLNLPVLTESDRKFISIGIEKNVDFFALSFVRNAKDVEALRTILKRAGSAARVISKIERQAAIRNFSEILDASDGIMIGRGDLGIEIPLPLVPLVQKDIIHRCRDAGKPVITATQMLESMIANYRPTRAEASDVANAILDGTDAIMLSAESATGSYPVEAVNFMSRVDQTIQERGLEEMRLEHGKPESMTEAISQAVDTLSFNQLDFNSIILLTETGRTARAIAKFRPEQKIFAVTRNPKIANQLSLSWGIQSRVFDFGKESNESIFGRVISGLKKEGFLSSGDKVICVSGQIVGKENLTNSIIVNEVK